MKQPTAEQRAAWEASWLSRPEPADYRNWLERKLAALEIENAALKASIDALLIDSKRDAELVAEAHGELLKLKAEVARLSAPVRHPKRIVVYETPDGDKMDPECLPICVALNQMEGIETIASCCGHGYAPFRIYFTAEYLADIKPVLAVIDEREDWRMRVSMATGNMNAYFVVEGLRGMQSKPSPDELTAIIAARTTPAKEQP